MPHSLSLIFIWHMHQPYYKDPLRGEYAMPWVYLHGIKDYYDMPSIVDQTPGARAVFNLVPSLVEQLLDYVEGRAIDPFLTLARKDPSDLTEDDKRFMLENFFSANRQRMIEPYPRYLELLYLAGDGAHDLVRERVKTFSRQEWLDLQVWFFLAWTGEAARRKFPVFLKLIEKGRSFTPEDKAALFDAQQTLLAAILPLYKRLQDEGKVELSVTPYYHPILPLLCSMNDARKAMPRVELPSAHIVWPEDARAQVVRSVDAFAQWFGHPPAGIWPSEGSVSDAALDIIAECGFTWAATDEGVLVKSLESGLGAGRQALYQSYLFNHGRNLNLFFRDHALSDLIGFTYSQWSTEKAVDDFISRIRTIRSDSPGARVISVILDGENAWEYYPSNGFPFLQKLYQQIAAEPGFSLTTCSSYLGKRPSSPVLTHIHPGSWINANYGIWVGHPEENRAWDYIAAARARAVSMNRSVAHILAGDGGSDGEGDSVARAVVSSLYAAEGSDWFWWYGDDHFSPHADRFDLLFRHHLMYIYRLLGDEIPQYLYDPIKKCSPAGLVREAVALISPRITGLVGDYFEWLAAGLYDLSSQSSTMHSSERLLQSFYFGYDRMNLYLRVDGIHAMDRLLQVNDILTIYLCVAGSEHRLPVDLQRSDALLENRVSGSWQATKYNCHWQLRRILEMRFPLSAFSLKPGGEIFVYLTLHRNNEEIGRWPGDAPMKLNYLGEDLDLDNWLI